MTLLVLGSRGLDITESWWIKQWTRSYAEDEVTVYQQTAWSQPQTSLFSQYKSNIMMVNASSNDTISVESKTQHDLDFYMRIYVLITVSNIIVGTGRFAVLYWGALRANKTLYGELLRRVFRAPLRFFDRTPLGRILNRFSKDFETIDSNIPNDVLNFVTEWVTIISSMLTVSAVLPIFLVPMLMVASTNILLGIKFVSTSRELKRMDSVSRSPLFSHFTETIVGVATVRAFGVTRLFLQNMLEYIDTNARPYYYTWTVNRHASVRFAITGAVINSLTAFIILLNVDKVDASLAGFCLSFVLLFTDQVNNIIFFLKKKGFC
jgi:ABC-type multidrug transport system fused ATPase/permease subunit